MTTRSASASVTQILFATMATLLAVVLGGCVMEYVPPTCEEISATTYTYDLSDLSEEHRTLALEAMASVSTGLNTKLVEVPSCAGQANCATVRYSEVEDRRVLGYCRLTDQILLSTWSFDPQLGRKVLAHEMIHCLRGDSLTGVEQHDSDPDGLMYFKAMSTRSALTDHDRAYICRTPE